MNKYLKVLLLVFGLLAVIYCCTLFWHNFSSIFNSSEAIKDFVLGYGVLSPFVFIGIVFLQVIFAPIPGQVVGFASGYIFGWELGTIYSMIGLVLGSYVVFYLSRRFGRRFVERVVKKDVLKRFDEKLLNFGGVSLFLIFLLPALPDDLICFVDGLSKIRMRMLVLIATIGRLPGFIILNLVGDGFFSYGSLYSVVVFGVVMIFSVILFLYRERLEEFSLRMVDFFRGLFMKKGVSESGGRGVKLKRKVARE